MTPAGRKALQQFSVSSLIALGIGPDSPRHGGTDREWSIFKPFVILNAVKDPSTRPPRSF
jgi:hypothetical protein